MSEHATEHSLYARDDASVANSRTCAEQQPPAHTNAQLGKGAWPAAMAPRTRRYDVPRYLYLIAAKGHRARRKEMQMTRYERVAWRALRDPSRFEARLHS